MMKALKVGLIGMVLGAAAAVGVSTLGAEDASAPLCCSKCDPVYYQCVSRCGGNTTCEVNCGLQYDQCSDSCFRGC